MHRRERSHVEEWASLLDATVPDETPGDDRDQASREPWSERTGE